MYLEQPIIIIIIIIVISNNDNNNNNNARFILHGLARSYAHETLIVQQTTKLASLTAMFHG